MTTTDDDEPYRPLIGPPNPATFGEISYGTIDEDATVPSAPSMVRAPGPRYGAVSAPARTPLQEAMHAAYTEHPIVGSVGSIRNAATKRMSTRQTEYDQI